MVSKYMIFASWFVAALVAVAAVADFFVGIPFANQKVVDVLFILSAALVIYMGFNAFKDLS